MYQDEGFFFFLPRLTMKQSDEYKLLDAFELESLRSLFTFYNDKLKSVSLASLRFL